MADARGQGEEILDSAGEADADHDPQQAGHVAELGGQHRADQWACAGDGREVVAEEHPLAGRVVVVPIVQTVRGRLACVV